MRRAPTSAPKYAITTDERCTAVTRRPRPPAARDDRRAEYLDDLPRSNWSLSREELAEISDQLRLEHVRMIVGEETE